MKRTEHRFADTLTELGRVGGSWSRQILARFDWTLVATIAAIVAIGLANLYSATSDTAHSGKFTSQLVWIAIGSCVFTAVGFFDYRALARFAWPILGVTVLVLIGMRVLTSADELGVRRWFSLGPIRVQPSEVTKIVVIIALARLFQSIADEELTRKGKIFGSLAVGTPVLLVAAQPDLGTAVLIALVILSVSLLCMRRLWPIAISFPLFCGLAPVLWNHMHTYQQKRVLSFLDPTADPLGSGWQTQQSIVAVGSGRITGKGFMHATQNQFNFLPEYWTDFPFSVFSEEWGFLGGVGLLSLMAWLVLWGIHIAVKSRDVFGTAIALGVSAMIFWHVVINTAMVLGLAPVVGLTFPLISYGGSSILTVMLALAVLSSVSSRA